MTSQVESLEAELSETTNAYTALKATSSSERRELDLQSFCHEAYTALGCTGWGRVDVITDDKGFFYLLEVNTVPGMTKSSLVPRAAEAAGIKFDDAVYQILRTSLL